jgi:TRAP-type C4-dicarboxylate transport system permease small subunit
LSRMFSGRANVAARVMTNLFTAAITGLLAWHSWRFVQESRLYGDTLLTDVPAWILQSILPVGFILISYRYLLRVCRDLAGEK